jgi:hypothetical protein
MQFCCLEHLPMALIRTGDLVARVGLSFRRSCRAHGRLHWLRKRIWVPTQGYTFGSMALGGNSLVMLGSEIKLTIATANEARGDLIT